MVDNQGNVDKIVLYTRVQEKLSKFYEKYDSKEPRLSLIAKMASVSSVLRSHFEDLKFVGFYIVKDENWLEIGPYVSDILATPKIAFGKGVCGTCWEEGKTTIVNNVQKCNNYIACDEETNSEIVLPVIIDNKVVAVWDVDSVNVDRFDSVDQSNLEQIVTKFVINI
jgi:L-methionine (R)-S-oxide reductase